MQRRIVMVLLAGLLVAGCIPLSMPATDVSTTTARINSVGECASTACDTYFKYWRAADSEASAMTTEIREWRGLWQNTQFPTSEDIGGLERGTDYRYTFCGKEAEDTEFLCSPDVQSFRTREVAASSVAGAGMNVSPYELATDDPERVPSGQALVDTLKDRGVQIARLTYALDDDLALATDGGWKSVFERLGESGIDATIAIQTRDASTCNCGLNLTHRAIIDDPEQLIGRAQEVLDNIRNQHGGAFPPNFVGIDLNEPASNHPETRGVHLPRVLDAIREYSDLPTFAGGWVGEPVGKKGSGAGALCQDGSFVGDVLSPHIYMDGAGVTHRPPSLSRSTPSISHINANATSVTSPSFSPPANSVIYAVVATDGADVGAPQAVTGVSSTTGDGGRALNWKLLGSDDKVARSNEQLAGELGGAVEVWWAFNLHAQSDINVTAQLATPVPGPGRGGILQTLVFENASMNQARAAFAASGATTAATPSATLETTQPNSWVWGAVSNFSNAAIGKPMANQELLASSSNSTTGRAWWTQRLLSGTTKRKTSVTIGTTTPSVRHNMVAFEVLALPRHGRSGPGQPEVVESGPDVRGIGKNQQRVTSPAFSPPAGSVLYAIVVANGPDTGTPQGVTGVTNTGEPLRWELLRDPATGSTARSNEQSPGMLGGTAEVWWAYNPRAQTDITVSPGLSVPAVDPPKGTPDGFLQTVVVKNAAPDQTGAAITATSSADPAPPSATVTVSTPGSLVWSAVSTWANDTVGTPGPGQQRWRQSRNTTTQRAWWTQAVNGPISWSPRAGTEVTTNNTAPAAAHNMVSFEVKPGPVTDPAVFAAATSEYLQNMAEALQSKGCEDLPPMWVGEYGGGSGIWPTQDPGSPQHQQAVIRGTYDALIAERETFNITGASIWGMTPPNQEYRQRPFSKLSASPWAMLNHIDHRAVDTAPCPGCTVEGGTTYVPAFYDLPTLGWDD